LTLKEQRGRQPILEDKEEDFPRWTTGCSESCHQRAVVEKTSQQLEAAEDLSYDRLDCDTVQPSVHEDGGDMFFRKVANHHLQDNMSSDLRRPQSARTRMLKINLYFSVIDLDLH
jgi:hypothetical protein